MRKLICLCLALTFILSFASIAYASGVYEATGTPTATYFIDEQDNNSSFENMFGMKEKDMTTSEGLFGTSRIDTDIDSIGNKLKSKGLKVIEAVKTPCEVICIVAFILCCVLAAIGAVQKGPMLGKALVGALIAALAYGAIVYAEDIVAMVVAFFVS